MSNAIEVLEELSSAVDGFMCGALVDGSTGMILGSVGSGVDIELAAAGNSEVVRAKLKTMKSLGIKDAIEDILISLGKQYHIIRPCEKYEGVFFYTILDKTKSNLAMARRQVLSAENKVHIM